MRSPFDRVRVTLADGRNMTSEPVKYPRGHFERGVEREVLWEKFADCTANLLDEHRATQLFNALQDLPALSSLETLRPALAPAAE
jgi:2-methylcitrate dehydratase PrpD